MTTVIDRMHAVRLVVADSPVKAWKADTGTPRRSASRDR